MEKELPVSRFQKKSPVSMVPTAEIFNVKSGDDADNQNPERSFRGGTSKIIEKFFVNCYKQLDSLADFPSYFLLNFPSDYINPHLNEILEQLKKNNFIKQHFFDNQRFNDAPFFYSVNLVPNYAPSITDGIIIKKTLGFSFGKNAQEVFSKAVGEFLERYFFTIYHKKNFIRGSVDDLKKKKIPTLDLNLLAGFSDEQKMAHSKRQFNKKSVFYWEKGKRLSTNKTVYLPAQLIYWNYIPCYTPEDFEPILWEPNTNAAAGFFSLEEAILAGLYEAIQRDGFCIYWLNKLSPNLIDPETVPSADFQNLLAESKRYGFEIYCLNITTDLNVPAFAVIVSDPSGAGPRFVLGAGCQADPAKALYCALEESWACYYFMRGKTPPYFNLKQGYSPFKEAAIGQDERLSLWANPEMAEHFKFFISGKKIPFSEHSFNYPKKFKSPGEELNFLAKKLENMGPGYEVYYYQANHPFLSKIGYYVVKTITPQLIHLYLNEVNALLGGRRLKDVPGKLGFKAAEKWNPWPHPFP